jgi:hypothetical protein
MSLVVVLALSWVQDFSDFLGDHSDNTIKLGVNPQCNPMSSICSASVRNEGEFQRLSFSITHKNKNVAAESIEYSIKLIATGFDFDGIESISLYFDREGEKINRQLISLQADRSTQQVVPEKWFAKIKLPDAQIKSKRKDWLAIIILKSTKKEYRAEFPFYQP